MSYAGLVSGIFNVTCKAWLYSPILHRFSEILRYANGLKLPLSEIEFVTYKALSKWPSLLNFIANFNKVSDFK